MPELPEVECVRLSLERLVVGRRVTAVRVSRPGVITGARGDASLLVGDKVSKVIRHGKQLAVVGESGDSGGVSGGVSGGGNSGGRCVCVHLGMSGQLCVVDGQQGPATTTQRTSGVPGSGIGQALPPHTHVFWQLDGGLGLRFTDPRRFGGLWTFDDQDELVAQRWSRLGPDARRITAGQLSKGLAKTRRSLKAALLDQHLIAGLGNIYVDELLFNARLHPLTPASAINPAQLPGVVRRMRTLLTGAIARGGSSLRDYVDGDGRQGGQQARHRVYGRAGLVCKRRGCTGVIISEQVTGRTTAWCPRCQPSEG